MRLKIVSSPNNHRGIQDCPYKGLMPYLEEDADFFFGREKWSRIITDNLIASRLTLVYGTSGVGKTSILRAGVTHHLRQLAKKNLEEAGQPEFAVVAFNAWRDEPLAGLVQQVEKDVREIFPEVQVPERWTSLAKTLEDWANALVSAQEDSGKLFIILDQFEEYFLYHPHEDGKGTFAVEFPRAVNQSGLPVNFLISIREDALAKLDRFKGRISNLFGNYLRIPHLDEESAVDAIRQPLRVFNQRQKPGAKSIGIETELVKEILEEFKGGKISIVESGRGKVDPQLAETEEKIETPYLQLVMTRLWNEEMKEGSDSLQLGTFKRLGGAENIVKRHLNEQIEPLSRREKDIAAKVFQYLVTPGGTKIAYPALELAETARVKRNELEDLLEKLSKSGQRILRPVGASSEKPNVKRYEIFHDKLAPAILEWRKEYLQKQKIKKSWEASIGIATVILAIALLLFQVKQTTETVSQIPLSLQISKSLSDSQRNFNSILYGLTAFRKLKQAEKNPIVSLLLSTKEKKGLLRDIQEVLQSNLAQVNEQNRLAGHEKEVIDVSFSSDGKILATASTDGTVKLWSLDGKLLENLKGEGDQAQFRDVVFSPDGQILAAASTDGTVRLWRLNGKKIEELEPLKGHKGWVWDVSFSPDGQVLASTGGADKIVKIWCFDGQKFKPEPIDQSKAHEKAIHKINFSPDGKILAAASDDKTVKLWHFDGKQIEFLTSLRGHTDSVWDVSFSSDGQILATASADNTAKLWNLDGSERITLKGHNAIVLSVSFTTYGQNKEAVIATASEDRTVKLWNLEGKELQTLTGHKGGVWRASFSPDGKILATASRDKTVKLWNLNPQDLFGHTRDIFEVSFSPDGKILGTASTDGTVKLWSFDEQDVRYIRYIKTLKPHDKWVTAISFSPDGKSIATASADTTAKIWSLKDNGILTPITLKGHSSWVWDVGFSPKGNIIATASADKTAKLWTIDGQLLPPLLEHDEVIRSLSFSPDGQMLATASRDNIIKLWSLDEQEFKKEFGNSCKGVECWLTNISFSPDNQTIATASLNGTVQLWSVDGQKRTPLEGNNSKIRHDSPIWNVNFNPDGQLLATASEDATVKLWNLDGELLKIFFGHIDRVISASFSPDGKFIASSSRDRRVILWNRDLKLEDIVGRSCDWVRGYLENNPNVKIEDQNRSRSDQYQSLCQEMDKYIKSQN